MKIKVVEFVIYSIMYIFINKVLCEKLILELVGVGIVVERFCVFFQGQKKKVLGCYLEFKWFIKFCFNLKILQLGKFKLYIIEFLGRKLWLNFGKMIEE